MQTRQIPIEKASKHQLVFFATMIMGLEIPDNATKETIIGAVYAAGWPNEHIVEYQTGGEEITTQTIESSDGYVFEFNGRQMASIIIHNSDKPGGERPVQCGVNGKVVLLKRGEPIGVPLEYVETLNNAEELIYEQDASNPTGGIRLARAVKSYPFSYHGARPDPRNIVGYDPEKHIA